MGDPVFPQALAASASQLWEMGDLTLCFVVTLCFVGIVFVGDACGVDDGGDAAGCFGLVRGVAADLDVAVKSPAPFGFMPYASIDGESMF